MSTIRQIRFRQVIRPMRTVFATALGRKSAATSVLVKVALADGGEGVGEIPTSFVLKHETPPAIQKVLAEVRGEFVGLPIDEYGRKITELRGRYPAFRMTVSGLEVACFRAWLGHRRISEHAYWGAKRTEIETDITIPFIRDTEMLSKWMDRAIKTGFRTYKVKVSGSPEIDVAFVRRVKEILIRRGRFSDHAPPIRLDGNQGYGVGSFLRMLRLLDRADIAVELFEQPLPKDDYRGLREIRKRSPIPIILDETVFDSGDCRRVIEERLGDGVNIKVAKSGIAESAAILGLAKRAGLKLMVGCMTETMVGLSAGIYLAAGTGAFDYVDLDSVHFLFHRARRGDVRVVGPTFTIGKV